MIFNTEPRKHFLRAPIFLFFLTIGCLANSAEDEFNKLFLQASLSKIHLDDKYGGGRDYFIKWGEKQPIVSVFFTPHFQDDYDNVIKKQIEDITTKITTVTGVGFNIGKANIKHDKSNFHVVIGTREQLLTTVLNLEKRLGRGGLYKTLVEQKEAGFATCGFLLSSDKSSGKILFVLMTLEVGPELEKCIYEEFFQAMGLQYDANLKVDSILGSDNTLIHPTDIDWKMLRTLYDSRIKAGIKYSEPEITKIIKKINSD